MCPLSEPGVIVLNPEYGERLGEEVGLKNKRKIEFYNGPIECRLLEYELYGGTRRKFD